MFAKFKTMELIYSISVGEPEGDNQDITKERPCRAAHLHNIIYLEKDNRVIRKQAPDKAYHQN